jgi:methyl-accepting chemotaxis protein
MITLTSVVNINDMNTQIATAAQVQQHSAEEISVRIEEIKTLSDQTAKGSEEINSSAEHLVELNDATNQEVRKFNF